MTNVLRNIQAWRCCALVASALWCAVVADVQAQSDSVRLHRLQEVIVHSSHSEGGVAPAQTLQGKELKRLSVLSVADALRYFSGVQIKDYGGIGGLKTINVRSMGTNHTAVTYDGIAIGNAQNGQVDLGRFSLDNIEAVSLTGGIRTGELLTASDYGSASLVYLQSKMPVFFNGRRNVEARLRVASFDTYNPSVRWDEKLGKNISSTFSAEAMQTSGRYKFSYRTTDAAGSLANDTSAVRRNGDVRAWRAEWGVFGTTQDVYWRTKLYLYTSRRGLPGAVVRGRFAHEDRQWDTNLFAQTSARRTWGNYGIKLNAKYAYDYLRYLSDPRKDAGVMYVDNNYRQTEAYLSVSQQYKLQDVWAFSLATDYRFNGLSANLTDFALPKRQSLLMATAATYQTHCWQVQGSFLTQHVADQTQVGQASASLTRFSPFVAVTFRPNKHTEMRAYYKQTLRMPTLNDLYYTFIGNIHLRPEEATQWNVGATWQKGEVRFEVDGYRNRIINKIVAVPTSNQFRWTMTNLGEVSIRGIDVKLAMAGRIGDVQTQMRATYTYQQAVDVTSKTDLYYKHQIAYIPRHSGSLVMGGQWNRWWANYSFIYTGQRYDQQMNIAENFVPAWYTSDLAVGSQLRLFNRNVKASVEVNNLFHQQYEVVKGYPMPGINWRINMTVEI